MTSPNVLDVMGEMYSAFNDLLDPDVNHDVFDQEANLKAAHKALVSYRELNSSRASAEKSDAKASDQWQPIDSCPKTGWFLAYKNGLIHTTMRSLCFPKLSEASPHRKPTHWMPLPNPPKET